MSILNQGHQELSGKSDKNNSLKPNQTTPSEHCQRSAQMFQLRSASKCQNSGEQSVSSTARPTVLGHESQELIEYDYQMQDFYGVLEVG